MKRRIARTVAAAAAVAAAFTALVPTGTSFAIDKVDCGGRSDYLHLFYHYQEPVTHHYEQCFRNGGVFSFGYNVWVEKISTGNNKVKYYDTNGSTKTIEPRNIISFPNRPPSIEKFEIL